MHSDQIVPIVTTTRMQPTRAFWVDRLGLQVSFDHAHYRARTFTLQDPNGVVVFVSHPIPAAVEYQACVR